MESEAEMMARHGRLLARFAEQAASLAEDLHGCALAAESPEEKQAISLAFHRMGRALRQSVALEAKLRRDFARAEREEKTASAGERRAAALAKVRATLSRLIHQEAKTRGGLEGQWFRRDSLERLERVLDGEEAKTLVPEDVTGFIERLCRRFGVEPDHEPGPPPARSAKRGRWSEGPEGVAARGPATQPPQSLRDSSPSGGST
jgi:hypothetical protein